MKDDLEQQAQALCRGLPRTDPTPAWKQDILSRACRELPSSGKPPRLLLSLLGAAWVCIFFLWVSTPDNDGGRQGEAARSAALPHDPAVNDVPAVGVFALNSFHPNLSIAQP